MRHPLGPWHAMFIGFYTPKTIAKLLYRKSPQVSAIVLESMRPTRSAQIIKELPTDYQAKTMASMGKYLNLLLKHFKDKALADLIAKTKPAMAQRISSKVNDERLTDLLEYWQESDLYSIFTKLSVEKTAMLLSQFEESKRISIMTNLPTWVQAPLIANAEPEVRSELLDRINLQTAIDLMSRWSESLKSDVIMLLKKERRVEILLSMRAEDVASLMSTWNDEIVLETLVAFKDQQRLVHILLNLPVAQRKEIFTILPPKDQHFIVANLASEQAVEFLTFMKDEEIENHLKELDEVSKTLLLDKLDRVGKDTSPFRTKKRKR